MVGLHHLTFRQKIDHHDQRAKHLTKSVVTKTKQKKETSGVKNSFKINNLNIDQGYKEPHKIGTTKQDQEEMMNLDLDFADAEIQNFEMTIVEWMANKFEERWDQSQFKTGSKKLFNIKIKESTVSIPYF